MTKQSPEDREPRNSELCHWQKSALVRFLNASFVMPLPFDAKIGVDHLLVA